MANYWLCVTSEENWNVIRTQKVWGVSRRNRRQLENVKKGDFFVFYAKKRGLTGIFKVISKPFEDQKRLFKGADKVFPYRVKLESFILPKKIVRFEELARKLKFIGEEKWNVYLQVAMRKITEEDYKTIKATLSAAHV
jgi:predicted RNA-binding protein